MNDYGPYGPLPAGLGGPARRRRRLRPLGCLTLLVILAVLAAAAYALLSPFALHIGGRSTLVDRTWHGVGAITATNGGRYAVYVSFRADVSHEGSSSDPYHCSQPGCDTIHGDGKLCTLSGTYPLEVEGEVYAWWSTDGALTHVRLSVPNSKGSTIVALFEGRWRGPELPLTDSTEFTVALTREGAIRAARSTTDDGIARTTLRYGGEDDFASACRALAGR